MEWFGHATFLLCVSVTHAKSLQGCSGQLHAQHVHQKCKKIVIVQRLNLSSTGVAAPHHIDIIIK